MIKQLLKESKKYLLEKPKFIKLSFWIGFCRSISIILLIAYNINNILIYRFEKGLSIFTMFQYFIDEITKNHIVWIVVILAIIFALGYIILYPMGLAAMIHFLNNNKNSASKAIGKGVNDFFSMFELNALTFSFGAYTFMITALRLITLDVINSGFIIGLFILWGIIVLFASIFWQYAKYIIIDEQVGIFEAIKKSMSLSMTNLGLTLKGVITKAIILIIFYFKLTIIVGIPLLIMYLLITNNLIHNGNERIMRTIGIVSIIITSYTLTTIQAFFMTFWHKIYHHILTKGDNDDE